MTKQQITLPSNWKMRDYREINLKVYLYENSTGYHVLVFGGKTTNKPLFSSKFNAVNQRENYLNAFILHALLNTHNKGNFQRRFEIGDIIYGDDKDGKSNDFFEVVGKTKNNLLNLRLLKSRHHGDGITILKGYKMPLAGNYWEEEILVGSIGINNSIKIGQDIIAYAWDGEPKPYYFGHGLEPINLIQL